MDFDRTARPSVAAVATVAAVSTWSQHRPTPARIIDDPALPILAVESSVTGCAGAGDPELADDVGGHDGHVCVDE